MVDIVKADAVVQGIRVTAQGAFPIGQDDSGDFTLTAQDMAAVREQLNQILNYMDRVKWPDASPPRLIVNLSDDPKGGVRIGMDLQAPFSGTENHGQGFPVQWGLRRFRYHGQTLYHAGCGNGRFRQPFPSGRFEKAHADLGCPQYGSAGLLGGGYC